MYQNQVISLLLREVHLDAVILSIRMTVSTFKMGSLLADDNKENYPESTFFWTPKCMGGGLGPDVYEVPNTFMDYDKLYGKYHLWDLKVSVSKLKPELNFDNYDKSYFIYSKFTQPLLNTIIQADSVFEIGLQMTLYCGLLEHMAEDKPKHPSVISEIDSLIEHARLSSLSQEEKSSLVSYLGFGKNISSRQKCRLLCQQYAKDQYGPYTTKEILDDAYSMDCCLHPLAPPNQARGCIFCLCIVLPKITFRALEAGKPGRDHQMRCASTKDKKSPYSLNDSFHYKRKKSPRNMIAPAQFPEPPTRVGNNISIRGRILNTQAQRGREVHPLTTGTNRDTPIIRNPR